MTNLTAKEQKVLVAFIMEGAGCMGAETMTDLIEDNMTWMNAKDIQQDTGYSKHEVAGIMSSLSNKGLIVDSGESARGVAQSDWYASEKGIAIGWNLANI